MGNESEKREEKSKVRKENESEMTNEFEKRVNESEVW